MIDSRLIEIVLTEQRQEIEQKRKTRLCKRFGERQIDLESDLAQVVIGVRRSGKSTLCYSALESSGVRYAYVNFDDERLKGLGSEDLNQVLEVLYKVYGDFSHLFLDEIQDVEGWHLFVNRLLRKQMRVVVTGSNAKLLSSELATHLTGRHSAIALFPFSFAEFCAYTGVDTKSLTTQAEGFRAAAFDAYLQQGGFPELMRVKNSTEYINNLVNSILMRDIETRYKIRYVKTFENLANHILNMVPTVENDTEWAKLFGIKSVHTVENYVGFLEQAFLLQPLRKYATQSKQRVHDIKLYPVDVALMNKRNDAFVGDNLGFRLETLVFIELLRRTKPEGLNVYYYKKRANTEEVDFVVCKGNKVLKAIQVSYDITNEKTYRREINGLLSAARSTDCDDLLLITDHARADVEAEGRRIAIRPAREWLLEN
ncbi:MAG: ATP-binding protein [Fibrobacter sp.]|nr:ATP-binding protein [Fibrobacter sp.]